MLHGRVSAGTASMRSGSGPDATVIAEISRGTQFQVMHFDSRSAEGQCKIKLENGQVGYVVDSLIEAFRGCTAAKALQLRSTEGKTFPIHPGHHLLAWLPLRSEHLENYSSVLVEVESHGVAGTVFGARNLKVLPLDFSTEASQGRARKQQQPSIVVGTDSVEVSLPYVHELKWPKFCACCGEPTEETHELRGAGPASVSFGGSSETEHYDLFRVPYCSACAKHVKGRQNLKGLIPASFMMIFILAMILSSASNRGSSLSWAFAFGALAVGGLGFAYTRSLLRLKKKTCPSLKAAVEFTSIGDSELNFVFRNREYADRFAAANAAPPV